MHAIKVLVAALTASLALTLPSLAQQTQTQPRTPTLLPSPAVPLQTDDRAPPAPPVATSPQLDRADVDTWLDGFMPYALQRGDVAGAVVVVVKDGQVLTQRGFGYADVAKRTPVDPENTLFRPGSVSKLFTWTAVMQLVEQGRLDLDRDVNDYLDFRIEPRDGKPITLRNILTHTAGFEEASKGLITSKIDDVLPLDQVMKKWTPERVFAPGTTPAYSNYATALAGYIVQRVSGEPFDVYIARHIFAPLGMRQSSFSQPLQPRLAAVMSNGYKSGSGQPEAYEYVEPAPAGSLASTGADMAKFMIAHLQKGGAGSVRILRPETAAMMHDTSLTILPPLNRMLLGFYEKDINGRRVISHAGDTRYFHSELNLWVDDGVGVFISVNSTGKAGGAGDVRTALFERFADRYLPGPTVDGKVDPKVAAEHARMIAGLYANSRRSQSSFMAIGGLLGQTEVVANGDGTITIAGSEGIDDTVKKWREISPFVWRETNGKNLLAAQVVDGRVVRFSIDPIAPFMVFDRVVWWKSTAWLLPLLYVALGALLLTVVLWPVAALVRRRYGASFGLSGQDARGHRLVRIAGVAVLAVLAGWFAAMSRMFSNFDLLSEGMDNWLRLLQVLSLVVFLGAPAIALWNLWLVWRGKRGWLAKLWSVVLVLACLVVLWVALAFNLIGFSVNY